MESRTHPSAEFEAVDPRATATAAGRRTFLARWTTSSTFPGGQVRNADRMHFSEGREEWERLGARNGRIWRAIARLGIDEAVVGSDSGTPNDGDADAHVRLPLLWFVYG